MKRDVLHVLYVAFCVFTSIFLVVLYARSYAVASSGSSTVPMPATIYRTMYLVEIKYVSVPDKDPTTAPQISEGKI